MLTVKMSNPLIVQHLATNNQSSYRGSCNLGQSSFGNFRQFLHMHLIAKWYQTSTGLMIQLCCGLKIFIFNYLVK